jgi:hypothetical protein
VSGEPPGGYSSIVHAFRRHLHSCAALALLAMAALALGPTISRLLLPRTDAAPGGPGMPPAVARGAESPGPQHGAAHRPADSHAHHHHGTAMLPAAPEVLASEDVPATPHPASHHHSLEHCGLCVVAACAFAVAPQPPALISIDACYRVARSARPSLPPLRIVWSPASPRGPPSSLA